MEAPLQQGSDTGSPRTGDWRPWAALAVLLVLGGALHRYATATLRPLEKREIKLPVPLSNFPLEIDGWTGEDRPMTPEVEAVAGNTDYVNRLYVNRATGQSASFYIAYSARPRTMVGHRPQVCYTTHGWVSAGAGTRPVQLDLSDGRTLPCLIHRFKRPMDDAQEIVVLNYYVLNGVATNDEGRFAGVGWRLPNIAGDPAYYVAQVQISSGSEADVMALCAVAADHVFDFLPDAEGVVRVAQPRGAAGGGQ